MLSREELKRFHKAVEIIDEYFDFNRFNTEKLDKVINLGEQHNLEGINAILNKNKCITSDELLEDMFKITFKEINAESHKLGFSKIY